MDELAKDSAPRAPIQWDEKTVEQRSEVLRDEIRSLRWQIASMRRLVDKLVKHSHQDDGKMVVPFERYGDPEERALGSLDPLA